MFSFFLDLAWYCERGRNTRKRKPIGIEAVEKSEAKFSDKTTFCFLIDLFFCLFSLWSFLSHCFIPLSEKKSCEHWQIYIYVYISSQATGFLNFSWTFHPSKVCHMMEKEKFENNFHSSQMKVKLLRKRIFFSF